MNGARGLCFEKLLFMGLCCIGEAFPNDFGVPFFGSVLHRMISYIYI